MAEHTLLRLLPPADADAAESRDPALWRACWIRAGEADDRLHCGTLADAGRVLQGVSPVVYVPGETILLTEVELPRGRRAQLLAALPYALEDQLIDDVERLHFVLGSHQGDGRWQAAVVDRACMETWLAVLGAAGITPDNLLPDTLLPPLQPGAWTLACEDERIVLRMGRLDGLISHAAMFPLLLKKALADRDCPQRLLAIGCEAAREAFAAACPEAEIETVAPASSETAVLNTLLPRAEPVDLNLLQGPYSPRSQLAAVVRPWLPAAGLLGLLLVLGLVGLVGEYRGLQQQSARLDAQMKTVFRQTFPEVKRVVNPRTQMRHRLATLRGSEGDSGPGFTHMLARLAPIVRKHPRVEVTHLRYANGRMEIRLVTPDIKTLDALREDLARATEWQIELKSANASGDRVDGRIVISP